MLLFFQTAYLPYHDEITTFVQQVLVALGAFCAVRYVPEIMRATGSVNASRMDRTLRKLFVGSFVSIGLFSLFVATIPDSLLDRLTRGVWPKQVTMGDSRFSRPVFFPTALLFEGDSNTVSGRPSSPGSRNLVVIDSFREDKDKPSKSLSLRGRDLRYGIFDRSDLSGADFTGAKLDGARFSASILKIAIFGCGSLAPSQLSQLAAETLSRLSARQKIDPVPNGPMESCAMLQYGSFSRADLRGAKFATSRTAKAKLDHVDFSGAVMQGADFSDINLTGSSFAGAKLQKTNFRDADLLGASFAGANAEESVFDKSDLILANMSQGVFDRSSFRGTTMILSDAKNASFLKATFTDSELYGTTLAKSLLLDAKFPNISAFVFADLTDAKIEFSEASSLKLPDWFKSLDETEAKWQSSEDYTILKAARGVLSDKHYTFFQSAIPLARAMSCLSLRFMAELTSKFEQNVRGGYDVGGWDSSYISTPHFSYIAKGTQGFVEAKKRLDVALGYSIPEHRPDSLYGFGSTDIYWDSSLEVGDPKPFLESLRIGSCLSAEKQPEVWNALIARLEIASQDYANLPERLGLSPSLEDNETGVNTREPAPNLR